MLGFDLVGLAKKEILAVDFNKNKKPDVLEALQAIAEGEKKIEPLLARVDEADVKKVVDALNILLGSKFEKAEVAEAVAGFVAIKQGLAKLPALCEQTEKQLKGK